MTDSDYALIYAHGNRQHEDVVLRLANFTPDEADLFRLIRHHYNPDAKFIEDAMSIDARARRRIEHGMRLKVAYLIMEAIAEYGSNH